MKHRLRLVAVLLFVTAVFTFFCVYSKDRAEAATRPQEAARSAVTSQPSEGAADDQAASALPENQYGPSFASLAWSIFLQVMTPAEHSLTFETWTEQCELNPDMAGCPSAASRAAAVNTGGRGKVRLLHGSAFTRNKKIEGSNCGAMTTTAIGDYAPPANLTRNASYCEEVFVSPAEAGFVKRNLTTLVSQQAYGKARSGAINFPGTEQNEFRLDIDSLEVKVDWVPMSSYSPTFACPDPTDSLYTETINGTCYALAAVHITSKVMPNWLWATFEPNSKITNPNRCDPRLYGTCLDPWGTTSSRPYAKGQTAQQSPELRQAMAEAHLPRAFNNYFLTGVQTQFVDNYGKPIALGNSFIEFNQGVPPGKSSCITCHQYASFDGKQPAGGTAENNFGRPPHGWPGVGYACNQNQNGNCLPVNPAATTQDFSWMLGLMPYQDAGPKAPADASQIYVSKSTKPAAQQPKTIARPEVEPLPAAPSVLPALTLSADQPPRRAKVIWSSHKLEIEASNASLDQILHEVAADTGATLEGFTADQRVFGSYGPGPGCDVLSELLQGSGYNVIIVGSHDADAPLEIVLSLRSPAREQTAADKQNASRLAQTQASLQREPDPQPESFAEPHPQAVQNPFANGAATSDPMQFMQEVLQRQQRIDEQQQEQKEHAQP